ncbi:MAG: hypothetical protein ACLFU2_06935 [Opitutales bacterium]
MPQTFAALDALYPLPAAELHHQWVLTHNAEHVPVGWRRESLAGWHLGMHPTTRWCRLEARDGAALGWLLAPLVYLGRNGAVEFPDAVLVLPVVGTATADEIGGVLYGRDEAGHSDGSGVYGSWTAILLGEPGEDAAARQRVFLGPTHSVVFDRAHRVVAATPNLMPELRRHEALSEAFDPLETNRHFCLGLTAFEGVERLLPNHCLDLETFTPQRHWPVQVESLASGEEGAARVVEQGRRLVEALATRHDQFHVFLSAGRDSRAVLALARPLRERGCSLTVSTGYGEDLASRIDLHAARRLARLARLPHVANKRIPPSGGDRLRAFVLIGEARAGKVLSWPRHKPPDWLSERFKLSGMAGETGRAYYWAEDPPPAGELSAETLLRRLKVPRRPETLTAAEEWLGTLPAAVRASATLSLDLAYVEHRLGCWEAPIRYRSATAGPPMVFSPMASAVCLETMLRLPESYRASGRLQHDMVAYGWPELLRVPFNELVGRLRFEESVRRVGGKALNFSRRVTRKLLRH